MATDKPRPEKDGLKYKSISGQHDPIIEIAKVYNKETVAVAHVEDRINEGSVQWEKAEDNLVVLGIIIKVKMGVEDSWVVQGKSMVDFVKDRHRQKDIE